MNDIFDKFSTGKKKEKWTHIRQLTRLQNICAQKKCVVDAIGIISNKGREERKRIEFETRVLSENILYMYHNVRGCR